ncbi:MAG: cytochrome D1 domain-containing protein [Gammaproteobacteria bacterium]|nr:cytochrome D1 domain-containing protein [Gammaproteobacteria bacterium]
MTNQDDSTLSIIDTLNPSIIGTVDVGDSPEGVDITPDGKYIYVANWGDGSISIINADTLIVEKTLQTGKGSRAFGKFISQ